MIDTTGPYWMVLVNVIASLLIVSGICIYRYKFNKKKINPFIILILVSILPVISIFRPGVYQSGDLSTHIMGEILFNKLLHQGELFPIWAGEMNATYGYPAFHFIYPLPFYVMAIFHFLGFSFINSAKLLLASSFFVSGIFMYFWLTKEVKKKAALVGSIFYLFAPYYLIDLHFRADIGEVLAFAFMPLCLLAAKNVIQKKTVRWFIFEAASFALLLLSHPAISLAGFVVLPLYILIVIIRQKRNKIKLLLIQLACIVTALLLSAFYWLPVLYDLQFTISHTFSKTVSFLQLQDLLFSPWRFGFLFQGPNGKLAFILGYTQLFMVILSIIMLIKRRISLKEKPLLLLSIIMFLISVIMMMEISSPIWNIVPFLKSFQFSYRLLGTTILTTAVIAAIVVNNIKKPWIIIVICSVAIFSTILNWGNRGTLPHITDDMLRKQIPFTATNGAGLGQAATFWSDPKNTWARKIPSNHIEIINGKGTIKELERTNIRHTYFINAKTQVTVKENTLYFPGWNVYIDQNPQKIDILTSTTPKGVISFVIPKGKHTIEVVFQDTFIITVGKTISFITLLFIIIVSSLSFSKMHKIKTSNIDK